MKRVDLQDVFVVHSGEVWPHAQPPCSRQMIKFLERNEDVVTWVQPNAGSVEDQFPVIRVDGEFFTMSLRMMKAVWRNVRLRKGFVNRERAPFGGYKLRIPSLLFMEKMRTQSRFNLMRMMEPSTTTTTVVADEEEDEGSQDQQHQQQGKERKVMHNASSKVSVVVHRMLFPLLDSPMRTHVLLDNDVDQTELDLLDQLGRRNPGIMDDHQTFVQHLLGLVERYKGSGGYTRVPTRESV